MHIAILGSGDVGGTLGRRWADAGHAITFGMRDPARGASAVKGGGPLPASVRLTTPADAVRDADVVLLATPWAAVAAALRDAGADAGALDGVTLIDATNPLGTQFRLDVGADGASGAERVQRMVPKAHVVKCFNSTGFGNMAEPGYHGAASVMFHAGDDATAKARVHALAAAIGFESIDAGALVRSRELEWLASLWIGLAVGGMGRDFAFRVVRR